MPLWHRYVFNRGAICKRTCRASRGNLLSAPAANSFQTRQLRFNLDAKPFQTMPIDANPGKSMPAQGSRGAALSSMESLNVQRAPQAIKRVEPVYLHDSSCGYIPYPVPTVSHTTVDDPVDSRGDEFVAPIAKQCAEQTADDTTTLDNARKHKPGSRPGLSHCRREIGSAQ